MKKYIALNLLVATLALSQAPVAYSQENIRIIAPETRNVMVTANMKCDAVLQAYESMLSAAIQDLAIVSRTNLTVYGRFPQVFGTIASTFDLYQRHDMAEGLRSGVKALETVRYQFCVII